MLLVVIYLLDDSVDILKVRILLVRHVSEGCCVKIMALIHLPVCHQLCTMLFFLLVLPDKGVTEDEEESKLNEVGKEQ